MARKAKIDYDRENDILWVYTGERVRDSLQVDKFVIDFSSENNVVGVEIMDASKVLSKLSLIKISKSMLPDIKAAKISVFQSKEIFYIVLGLIMIVGRVEKEIPIQVPAPIMAVPVRN